MKHRIRNLALALCLAAFPMAAQEAGTASGKGTMERSVPGKTAGPTKEVYETVEFVPRFSFACRDGSGAEAETLIVLTEKPPPVKDWLAAEDRLNALRIWSGKEKASFAALELDDKMAVAYYFVCSGDGRVTSKGLNVANGLESIVLKLLTRDAKRLKGTLKTGEGNCPGPNGASAYCETTGDFAFDVPIAR